jgi:hypothetical protein
VAVMIIRIVGVSRGTGARLGRRDKSRISDKDCEMLKKTCCVGEGPSALSRKIY